ncbi:MAG: hypothetical protein J0L92_02125 [Deltaproteobacteria bacterium]|nr:hypothetical protein [Deltaproteobacteria bacterium]
MRSALGVACLVGVASLLTTPAVVRAEDLVLMDEPTTYTDVVDAFDDHDVFDVNIHVGYLRSWELGRLQREVNGPAAEDGRSQSLLADVGNYELTRNGLMFGLDVGIFRDLAVYARLPLILSDDRTISPRSGLGSDVVADATGAPLIDLPIGGFRSPTRSGVDYLTVGLAWSILNQHRQRWAPTWVVMLEGRFNLGEPMRACQQLDGSVRCRPDIDAMGNRTESTSPGVGRGVNALHIETRASFREGVLEPYFGLMAQIEWPGSAGSVFLPAGDLRGYINRIPPIQGRFTAGVAVIPWEERQHFQRFTFDLRFNADYVSEGRDYSPLFDALGSSTNPYLSTLNYEGVAGATNGVDGLARVQFTGHTDTQSHARIGGQITLEMQAAQYVRFQVGTLFMYSTPYNITQTDACNPNVRAADVSSDARLAGDCRPSASASNASIINPHHRPVIDMPGNRFRMSELWQIDLYANVTAMF